MDPQQFFSQNPYTVTNRCIYTPSVFARASLLSLQEAGSLRALRPHISKRSGLESFLFFIITDGAGNVQYKGQTVKLKKGDCMFIDCRHEYRHWSDDSESGENLESCDGYIDDLNDSDDVGTGLWALQWVHFTGPHMPIIYEKYLSRGGNFYFTPASPSKYENLLMDIYKIGTGNSYIRDMELNSKLNILLEYVMQETVTKEHDRKYGDTVNIAPRIDIQQAKDYIDAHYTEHISLETIAKVMSMNKHYLSKIFKGRYGVSVNTYISQLRITKAKGFLRFGRSVFVDGKNNRLMTVEEIAEACGYMDSNYFARVFKKLVGMNPSEYRNRWENRLKN